MWEGINQRKFPRANCKCRIRLQKKSKDKAVEACTENVGAGGICVPLEKDLGIFNEVNLELFLDQNKKAIMCSGKVVWVVKQGALKKESKSRYDTGIEFKNISEEDKMKVYRFVAKLLTSAA